MIFPGYMKPKGQIEARILSLWKSKYEKTVRKDGDRQLFPSHDFTDGFFMGGSKNSGF
jgi:hypothetical protein